MLYIIKYWFIKIFFGKDKARDFAVKTMYGDKKDKDVK